MYVCVLVCVCVRACVCVFVCVGFVQGLRTVYLNVTVIRLVLSGFWIFPNFQDTEWITKSRKE